MDATSQSVAGQDPEEPVIRIEEKRTLGDLLYALAERYATLWFLLLLALLAAAAVVGSRHKHFWYDELSTILVASQPTWHRFAQAMPADANPPISALLTRLSIHYFGVTNFGVRLPPLVGFLAALIGVYVFVRRECGAVFGLLAVAIVMAQPAWMYSFEARPYGLILGFTMLGVLSWQSATRAGDALPPRPRTLALTGLAACVAGCVLTHHLGVVDIGVPLVFGEATRLYTRRRIDWPLAATAVIAALCSLAISVPMIHRTNALLITHLPPVTMHTFVPYVAHIRTSMHAVLDVGTVEFLAGVLLLTWSPRFLRRLTFVSKSESVRVGAKTAPHIFAASVGLLLLIPLTIVIMSREGGWYFCRYGIGTILGIAILSTLLLSRQVGQGSLLTIALLLFLSCSFLRAFIQNVRHKEDDPLDSLVYNNKTTLPVVISDPLIYPATWWYAPAEMKDRVVYLYDTPEPLPPGYAMVSAALVAEKQLIASPLQTYDSFVASHDHFLLDTGLIDANLEDSLESAGYRVTQLRSDGDETLFDVQRER